MKAEKKQKVLVLTDNEILYGRFQSLLKDNPEFSAANFTFYRSKHSNIQKIYEDGIRELKVLDINQEADYVISNYQLVISLHCKQIFGEKILGGILCINIHPGYNPINRGWYPQVFALAYNFPLGATIHEITTEIDNGPIIARRKVDLKSWDTSETAYKKVLDCEMELLQENLGNILLGRYKAISDREDSNFYTRKDFKRLCEIDLDEKLSMRQAIDRLRALSHSGYQNAFFIDDDGNKIYVELKLNPHQG